MATVTVQQITGEREDSVAYYIANATESGTKGVAEAAHDQSSNAAAALGRLVEILVEKELLAEKELKYIAGTFAPEIVELTREGLADA